VIAFWTGDGSGGLNVAMPMNNNGWTDFTFPNVPGAQAPNGDFIYTLLITPLDPGMLGSAQNMFKVRAKEKLYVPAMVPITFITPFAAEESIEFFVEDILILYPNATTEDGKSFCGSTEICDLNDPSCCLFETTYDGMWSFFMEVPPGESALDIWDGDLDYGDLAGTVFDTDDPNTPGDPFLPGWSIGTDVVFETARPAIPKDNNGNSSEVLFVRDPNIQYLVIDPLGNQYQNSNPSGDREWELFRLDTTTDDPAIAEFRVDSIAPGLWEVKFIGVDLSNLFSILLPFDLRGEQVDDPGVPKPIPTLNEWGLIILAMFIGIVGLMAIRRRRVTA
jgi:exosortase sorting signal-containing protein